MQVTTIGLGFAEAVFQVRAIVALVVDGDRQRH